jgi:hypothetical protein
MLAPSTPTPSASRSRQPPVWLPWVSAPLFFLLPIGGCGVAATARRHPAADTAAAAHPLPGPVPVATMMTVLTPAR